MKRLATLIALVVVIVAAGTLRAQSGYDLFQKALATERADGNLREAIRLYERVTQDKGADRALVARALVRMAECHEKLGHTDARRIYERITREFADQQEPLAVARARLRVEEPRLGPARGDRVVWGPSRDVDLFGTVSPDGRYLTYVDWFGVGNVMLRDLQAGIDRPLTGNTAYGEHGYASWSAISRSGEFVAYSWGHKDGGDELRVASLKGQGVPASRLLVARHGFDSLHPFDWSPDGRSIALLIEREDRSSQLGLVDTQTGVVRILKSVEWRAVDKAVFSPDGRHLAYDLIDADTRAQQVLAMATDASRETVVTGGPQKNRLMAWADNGHLLFASDRTGTLGLWGVPMEAGRPQAAPALLKANLASSSSLGLARTGTLFIWKRAGSEHVSVAPVDVAAGQVGAPVDALQRFIESRGRPSWSADGTRLLYVSCGPTGGGPCRIVIHSGGAGADREVPHRLRYVGFPRFSPDGHSLLTSGTDLKGRSGAYQIDIKTGDTTLLALDEPAFRRRWPEWASDGKSIVYAHDQGEGPTRMLRRQLGSDVETEIFRTSVCTAGAVRLSPDGRFAACVVADRASRASVLTIMPVDGGGGRPLMRISAPESFGLWHWTADSQAIAVRRLLPGERAELWLAPIQGEARRVSANAGNWIDSFELSPDGRQIAFAASVGRSGAELWALENFLLAQPAKR